jgi:Au+-exporting ATPase
MNAHAKVQAAAPAKLTLSIAGMTCASCVGRVERALKSTPGVLDAQVNLATERAAVSGAVAAEALIAAVERVGYEAKLVSAEGNGERAQQKEAERRALQRDLAISATLTAPLFLLAMASHFVPGAQMSWRLQFALTTLVMLFPGRRFYVQGVPALWRFAPDMNSLVAVGSLAAYGYSLAATFAPGWLPVGAVHVYYEAAAVIVTLILLGRYLEARAKGRTSEAIRRLVRLQAKTARVRRGSDVLDLPMAAVQAGDLVEVRPGERVPLDGQVIEGESYVDESMISGEPVPVAKAAGAKVVGGTLNQKGAFAFRATAVGGDTVLAHIIRMVEEAQAGKLPIQALVDKVTLWFVPAVMGVAALTFAAWFVFGPAPALTFALVNAVAVLIVACPCAMGLATPTSIMVGTGRGAELGVLFRKGEALQRLRDAKVVAFDKTGTLTEGRPVLTDLELADGFARESVLAFIGAVEAKSEHPIARALVEAAAGLEAAPVAAFESVTGFGVKADVGGRRVEIGAERYMAQLGHDGTGFSAVAQRLAGEAKSPIYVAVDGRVAAVLAVADPIRTTTPQAITALQALGLKVAMITGDNAQTARAIAAALGIDEVVADVLPGGKVEAVRRLKRQYGGLAFVGDGINDAPALAEADVGVAIGAGADIAIEAADVVLMSGALQGVLTAIALSKATIGNIQQNLFWAFAYNIALIPLAAGAFYPAFGLLMSPALAAGAMAASSVFVVGNALRLRRFQPATIGDRR